MDSLFPEIKSFNWDDLDGKELKIFVQNGVDYGEGNPISTKVVWGVDYSNEKKPTVYILHSEQSE